MSMMKEFREFAIKGNLIDLAMDTIIGDAFGKIVASMVQDLMTPPRGRRGHQAPIMAARTAAIRLDGSARPLPARSKAVP